MSTHRFSAMQELFNRDPISVPAPEDKVSDFYGVNTFDLDTMKKYLPTEAYKSVKKGLGDGEGCYSLHSLVSSS